ncbi:hypothetical protein CALVIDRAFT_542599 [Calocera viscosa TUFC12733]|uniref:Uncharacterized protein n=1 Tax=Calocera viscosa (strain TUFC12733) TaxID=1330018 RepID=A0A167GHI9_CALVF|nr:hypothetical protein CALVIDRAFT_542599 [Calocera viscosa TUFC12733]
MEYVKMKSTHWWLTHQSKEEGHEPPAKKFNRNIQLDVGVLGSSGQPLLRDGSEWWSCMQRCSETLSKTASTDALKALEDSIKEEEKDCWRWHDENDKRWKDGQQGVLGNLVDAFLALSDIPNATEGMYPTLLRPTRVYRAGTAGATHRDEKGRYKVLAVPAATGWWQLLWQNRRLSHNSVSQLSVTQCGLECLSESWAFRASFEDNGGLRRAAFLTMDLLLELLNGGFEASLTASLPSMRDRFFPVWTYMDQNSEEKAFPTEEGTEGGSGALAWRTRASTRQAGSSSALPPNPNTNPEMVVLCFRVSICIPVPV